MADDERKLPAFSRKRHREEKSESEESSGEAADRATPVGAEVATQALSSTSASASLSRSMPSSGASMPQRPLHDQLGAYSGLSSRSSFPPLFAPMANSRDNLMEGTLNNLLRQQQFSQALAGASILGRFPTTASSIGQQDNISSMTSEQRASVLRLLSPSGPTSTSASLQPTLPPLSSLSLEQLQHLANLRQSLHHQNPAVYTGGTLRSAQPSIEELENILRRNRFDQHHSMLSPFLSLNPPSSSSHGLGMPGFSSRQFPNAASLSSAPLGLGAGSSTIMRSQGMFGGATGLSAASLLPPAASEHLLASSSANTARATALSSSTERPATAASAGRLPPAATSFSNQQEDPPPDTSSSGPPILPPLSRGSGLTGRQPVLLYMSFDDDNISRYQILARKQIELFEAKTEDVQTNARGRNRPIVLGQVGIRCRHCSHLPPRDRERAAHYYPSKLDGLYQAGAGMATVHLCVRCKHIPTDIREELIRLKGEKAAAQVGKRYWADGARVLGVIESEDGLRFQQQRSGDGVS